MTRVAVLGLGTMGAGMAGCLHKAGFDLTVWNRTPERTAPFAQAARIATSPHDAAEGADVIIGMLADDNVARSVWYSDNGALPAVNRGSVVIECSTLSPGFVRELADSAAQRGSEFLDAPVTGSKTHAAAGELKFLVGGNASTLDRVRPILSAMGKEIVHFGDTGSGALMKLINNFICGVQAAALAEGLALIEKGGLDRDKAVSILLNGAPGSPLLKAVSSRMLSRDYTVNFKLELMHKDISYAIAEAERYGLQLSTAAAARNLMEQAATNGFGKLDFAAVVEPLRTS